MESDRRPETNPQAELVLKWRTFLMELPTVVGSKQENAHKIKRNEIRFIKRQTKHKHKVSLDGKSKH